VHEMVGSRVKIHILTNSSGLAGVEPNPFSVVTLAAPALLIQTPEQSLSSVADAEVQPYIDRVDHHSRH